MAWMQVGGIACGPSLAGGSDQAGGYPRGVSRRASPCMPGGSPGNDRRQVGERRSPGTPLHGDRSPWLYAASYGPRAARTGCYPGQARKCRGGGRVLSASGGSADRSWFIRGWPAAWRRARDRLLTWPADAARLGLPDDARLQRGLQASAAHKGEGLHTGDCRRIGVLAVDRGRCLS
jgi:hypothetical protein